MKKNNKEKTPVSTGKKIKWIISGVIIILIAIGFYHQYYIHSDNYIIDFFEKNSVTFTDVSEKLLEKPTTQKQFSGEENEFINNQALIDIRVLIADSEYLEIKSQLESLEKADVSDIKSDGKTVSFQTLSRCTYIYSPQNKITDACEYKNGWYYLKGEK